MTWSSSSLVPSRPTMEWPSGITIRIVEPGLSLRVSVNSLLSEAQGTPRGRCAEDEPGAGHGWSRGRPARRSAGRPGHRAAAEQVRVHVPDSLPAVLAGVEDDPV